MSAQYILYSSLQCVRASDNTKYKTVKCKVTIVHFECSGVAVFTGAVPKSHSTAAIDFLMLV